ncbi:23S rRNA (guanosine(2251)-2'-O)-methyltransferase RlmB [Chloroflexota bacterium]
MTEIITGRNPVLEALRVGRPIQKILLARNISRHSVIAEILHLAQSEGVPVEYVPDNVLQKQAGTPGHQGIIAHTAAKDYVNLEDLFAISREKGEPPLYCILDGVEDPQNLGAIIRTAEASGTHGVIIRSRRAVGITAAVARASAGAVEYLPVARVVNIARVIEDLQEKGVWVSGIDPAGKVDYRRIDFTPPAAIVIGGEGQGLSELVRKKCDYLACIPMRGRISSLNASVAAALVMYEAFRQRHPRSGNTP